MILSTKLSVNLQLAALTLPYFFLMMLMLPVVMVRFVMIWDSRARGGGGPAHAGGQNMRGPVYMPVACCRSPDLPPPSIPILRLSIRTSPL